MIIANPLYDVVFKYLLEDMEIARNKMDVEDEIDRAFSREIQKVTTEKDKIIAEKDQALEEKDQALAAERRRIEELLKQIAELQDRTKK